MAEEFRPDREHHRFEAWVDGEFVGETTYLLEGDVATFDHTYIEPDRRESGVAGRLVQYAFDEVRREGRWRIRPLCPYVASWSRKHPEYNDLLA